MPSPGFDRSQTSRVNHDPSVVLTTGISSNKGSTVVTGGSRKIQDEWMNILNDPKLNKDPGALDMHKLLDKMKFHPDRNPQGILDPDRSRFPIRLKSLGWSLIPCIRRLPTFLSGAANLAFYKANPDTNNADLATKSEIGLSSNKARFWALASWVTTAGSLGLAFMSTTMNLLPGLAISSSVAPAAGLLLPAMICTGIVAAGKFVCDSIINRQLKSQFQKLTTFQLEQNAAGTAMSRETMLVQALLAYRAAVQPPFYAYYLDAAVWFEPQTNHFSHVMGRPLLQAMRIVVQNWAELSPNAKDKTAANSIRTEYDKQIQLLLNPQGQTPSYAQQYAGALGRVNDIPEMVQNSVGQYVGYVGFPIVSFFWTVIKVLA